MTAEILPYAERVVGIDVVWPMLRASARRIERAAFASADMRHIPFAQTFDLIVAPSDPISHWLQGNDRLRILREVRRAARPGGVFILDGLFRPEASEVKRSRRISLPEGSLTVDELWQPLGRRDLWSVRYRYRLAGDSGIRTQEAAFVARAWNPEELVRMLELAGFRLESLSGDFDRRPVDRRSPRLLAIARPAERTAVQRGTGPRATLAGPLRTSPSAVKREAWHGQSHDFSASFHPTMQSRCRQTADHS